MADNRVRLRCRACGGSSLWFAKMYGGWYVQPAVELTLVEALNAFFDEHDACAHGERDTFELEYEP